MHSHYVLFGYSSGYGMRCLQTDEMSHYWVLDLFFISKISYIFCMVIFHIKNIIHFLYGYFSYKKYHTFFVWLFLIWKISNIFRMVVTEAASRYSILECFGRKYYYLNRKFVFLMCCESPHLLVAVLYEIVFH